MTETPPHIVLLGGDGGRSGVPRHIEQICQALTADGDQTYRVTILSEVDKGGYTFAKAGPVTHKSLPDLASSANPLKVLRGLQALQAALAADPPDVIWAHARLPVLMIRLLRRRTAPLIVTFHGSPFAGRSSATAFLMRTIERLILRWAPPHRIVFLSQSDQDSFAGLPLHRHDVQILPNVAPDMDLPAQALPDHPTLLMTTRNAPQKNLLGAADVLAHLPDTTRLILYGTGTDNPDLRASIAARLHPDVVNRITFAGPTQDVGRALRSCHGYLLTSRYEGMSLGALEAFAAGVPIFMPDVGGRVEILDAHPMGALIDPDDPAGAAAAIRPVLSAFSKTPQESAIRITNAYNIAFSAPSWAKSIRQLVAATCSGHSGHSSLD